VVLASRPTHGPAYTIQTISSNKDRVRTGADFYVEVGYRSPMDTTDDDSLGGVIARLVSLGVSENEAEDAVLYAYYTGANSGISTGWLRGMVAGTLFTLFWSTVGWVWWR